MTFPTKKYSVIYADPAWSFKAYSNKGLKKSPQSHYDCMSLNDLKALPVSDIAEKDCVLFMWATFPMIHQALELIGAYGFTYKTGGVWHKKTKHGKTAFGTGYIFRSAAELLLVATKGKPKALNRSTRNVIEAQVREHSRKPDCTYELIENLYTGPFIELFARQRRAGWDAWGNQLEKFPEVRAAE
ncbi:MT-A70 family methyltransferase [Kiloniella majae]|uniref:MT-A70 family methyltransferase n=1 Tax=Kiloniella majae TaxID=1938558 RepID=UPI000A276E4F|nr:MT-A70 family methyltransferase [Kiloniella majae]